MESRREVEKSSILLKTEEAADDNLTCHVFSQEDAVTHFVASNVSGILTILAW